MDFYSRLQAEDGHWAGDYGGPLFLLPGDWKDFICLVIRWNPYIIESNEITNNKVTLLEVYFLCIDNAHTDKRRVLHGSGKNKNIRILKLFPLLC